jgi:tetratricopeptide (TPR) repeat protein
MKMHAPQSLALTVVVLVLLSVTVAPAFGQTPDAATKFRLAQGLENAGENEQALALYRELYVRDPANVVTFDALQRVLTRLKRYDELVGLIGERLASTPRDLGLWGQLGSAYYRGGQETLARAAWDSALAIDRRNPAVYRFVASVMIENRLLDRAAECYRRGRDACGDPSLFAFELSHLLAMSMDYRGATEELLRWLDKNPTQLPSVQARLAAFTGSPTGRAEAVDVVRRAVDRAGDVRLYELLSWLYLEGREYRRALEVVRALELKTGAQGTALLSFAERASADRAYAVSAEAYDLALATGLPRGKLPGARYGRAVASLGIAASVDTAAQPLVLSPVTGPEQLSLYRSSAAEFRKVIEEFPRTAWSARAHLQIGLIELRHLGDPDRALEHFRRAGEETSLTPAFRSTLILRSAEASTMKADTGTAALRYRAVAAAGDATPDQMDEATFRLAELDYFAGRAAEARVRLDSIALNPKADYANDALQLRSFLQEGDGAPDLARFGAADFLARQRKNAEALVALRDILRAAGTSVRAEEALMRVALLEAGAGRYAESAAALTELLGRPAPQSTGRDRAQFALGEVYEFGVKDRPAALAAYEKLLLDYPRSVWGAPARERIRRLRGGAS